tara:strand:+ start:8930 stop:9172 length:243 start_codon:yes stop_codon:yes gene_type:complete
MNIQVPTPEEYKANQKKKRRNLGCGLLAGLVFFFISGIRIFSYGFENVEVYTWIALAFGVLSFGYLAYKFGDSFWALFKK